jgi:hypothetical protein
MAGVVCAHINFKRNDATPILQATVSIPVTKHFDGKGQKGEAGSEKPAVKSPEVAVAGCHILLVGGCRETGISRRDPP